MSKDHMQLQGFEDENFLFYDATNQGQVLLLLDNKDQML